MAEIEIYFDELKPDLQKRILELAGVDRPEVCNWDTFPIAVIQV